MEITEIGLLAIKAESAYGTDPVPTPAANSIPPVGDSVSLTFEDENVERKLLDGTFDPVQGFSSLPNVTLKFRYELRGNRTNGTAADISAGSVANLIEIDPLLQAAGLNPTYTAETVLNARDGNVIYKPKMLVTVGPSVTCYFYTALKLHKLIGGKANIDSILIEPGKMGYIDFTVRGKYAAPSDLTFPTTAAFVATKPPVCENAAMSLGGASYTNPVFRRMEFMLGNSIARRENAAAADGVEGFVITSQRPKARITLESSSIADAPIFADWRTPTVRTAQFTLGSQTGNKVFVTGNTARLLKPTYANEDGKRMVNLELNLEKTSVGDAEGGHFIMKFF